MLSQTVERRVAKPRGHRTRDWLFVAAAAVILIFAVVGVVSAAGYVGERVATPPAKPHTRSHTNTSNQVALRDVARAQAQATAIVKAARQSAGSIVRSATKKAHRQASAIVAEAKKHARSRVAVAAASPPSNQAASAVPTVAPSTSAGSAVGAATGTAGSSSGASGYSAGSVSTPTTSVGSALSPSAGTSGPTAPGNSTSTSSPNLGNVPATWLVVAYNATFGKGPGNAGSIAVINRSSSTFSGVAQVRYIGPGGIIGTATAPFSGLAPGQSEVLPLNGMTYPSGAIRYQIQVVNVH